MMLNNFKVRTKSRNDFIEITNEINNLVKNSRIKNGLCVVYVPHTTAGVFINENADPTVLTDISNILDKLIPWKADYRHLEGNSAAHMKSILTGSSVQIIIENNKLILGTWQGIFFAEFDGPRERTILIKLIES